MTDQFQAEIINVFLKTTVDVLRLEVKAKFKRGEISISTGSFLSEDITTVIGVVGDILGQVYFSLSRETARKIISAMVQEEVAINDPSIQDGMAELGNVITGNASILLSSKGYNCDISPPALIMGRGLEISNFGISTIRIPVFTQFGLLNLRVGLKKK